MKSYTFKILIEEDTFPDGSIGYFVSVPALEHLGAATQGKTPKAALQNIQEVLHLILEELHEEGRPIPREGVIESEEPLVTVTLYAICHELYHGAVEAATTGARSAVSRPRMFSRLRLMASAIASGFRFPAGCVAVYD